MFSVEFYRRENGNAPDEDFLDQLPIKHRVKALDGLALLEEFGSALREPYSKSVGNGLFELRVKFSSDITRIFYFFFDGRRIILTNGFIKKTANTPPSELALARKHKQDYEGRNPRE